MAKHTKSVKKVLIKDEEGLDKEVTLNTPANYQAYVGRDITGSKKGRLIRASSREELKEKVAEATSGTSSKKGGK